MRRRRPLPGEFAMTEDDLDPEVEREIVTSDGEIVTLAPWVAHMRHVYRTEYEQRRLDYCRRTGRDPDTFTGCVDCAGTGHGQRGLACHCDQGKSVLRFQGRQDQTITDRLHEKIKDPTWASSERDRHNTKGQP